MFTSLLCLAILFVLLLSFFRTPWSIGAVLPTVCRLQRCFYDTFTVHIVHCSVLLQWKNAHIISLLSLHIKTTFQKQKHSHATNPHYSLSHLSYTLLWKNAFELHTVICSSWRDKDLILSGGQNIVDQLLRYTWNKQEGVRVWVLFRAFAQWEPFVIFGGRKGAENGKNWAIVRSLLWQVGLLRAN